MSLYSPQLIAFAKDQSHVGRVEGATHSGRLSNPLCGDRIDLDIRIESNRIEQIRHRTRGCILCQASAHLMCERVAGTPLTDALTQAQSHIEGIATLTTSDRAPLATQDLEDHFHQLHTAPSRESCVALPWRLLQSQLTPTP